jgi:hypothetical protein
VKDQDFDANSRKLLMRRIFEGSPDKSVNYAPDFRNGVAGPLTVLIAKTLRQHAALWAHDMRESRKLGVEIDGKRAFADHMREADEEIKRLVAGANLTTGAAA